MKEKEASESSSSSKPTDEGNSGDDEQTSKDTCVADSAPCTSEEERDSSTATDHQEDNTAGGKGNKAKDEEVVSSGDKMDTSPNVVPSSSSPSLGRRCGLPEQLSRTPASLSQLSNMASISAPLISGLSGSQDAAKQGEGMELPVGSDMLLLEGGAMAEEKEVGPEILGSDGQLSKLSTMMESSSELDKELNTSDLGGGLVHCNFQNPFLLSDVHIHCLLYTSDAADE